MNVPSNPKHVALEQYRRRASVYDAELTLFEPIRRAAVAALDLRPGDVVLDMGCGTGLSLPLLREAVGASGQVVGVEQSPDMLAHARQRVADQGWKNVTLIESAAEEARIGVRADAAFFHFTHDILSTPAAVANVVRSLKPGARVAAAGLQWSTSWLWPVNLFVLGAALHSVTSLAGLGRPWALLDECLDGLTIEPQAAGGVYIAKGTLRVTSN